VSELEKEVKRLRDIVESLPKDIEELKKVKGE